MSGRCVKHRVSFLCECAHRRHRCDAAVAVAVNARSAMTTTMKMTREMINTSCQCSSEATSSSTSKPSAQVAVPMPSSRPRGPGCTTWPCSWSMTRRTSIARTHQSQAPGTKRPLGTLHERDSDWSLVCAADAHPRISTKNHKPFVCMCRYRTHQARLLTVPS